MNEEYRLYIGNLEYNTTASDLTTYLEEAGKVFKVDIIRDGQTGRAKGFAFVNMENKESVIKAVEMFHLKEFRGRKLVVSEARPRPTYNPSPPRSTFR
jgi:RNA recognition motif-containing protein